MATNPLLFIGWYPPAHDGGDSIYARTLGQTLADRIGSLDIVSTQPQPASECIELDGNARVHFFPESKTEKLRELVQKADLLHFFQIQNVDLIEKALSLEKLPVVFHMQLCFARYAELFTPDYDHATYVRREEAAIRLAKAVWVPSQEEAAHVRRIYGKKEIEIIPNSIDFIQKTPRTKNATTRFIFGGRIDDPMKGAEPLLESLALLTPAERQRCSFTFFGVRDNRFTDLLCAYAPAVEYTIVPWTQDRNQFLTALARSDFAVVPSLYEPFGMICLEALARGVPPIGVATGGHADMIVQGKNGLLVPFSSPSGLARNLSGALREAIQMDASAYGAMSAQSLSSAHAYGATAVGDKVWRRYEAL